MITKVVIKSALVELFYILADYNIHREQVVIYGLFNMVKMFKAVEKFIDCQLWTVIRFLNVQKCETVKMQ